MEKHKVVELDFHKAITRKERSSRYIRTAIDYFLQLRGEEGLDQFLDSIGLNRESSIFKHVYNDENWNSYALEVYIYEKMLEKVQEPYQAVWDFGVASGSGLLDQKDTFFTFRLRMAPLKLILKKLSEITEKLSLISHSYGYMVVVPRKNLSRARGTRIHFNYDRLPSDFPFPHWTSIVAGYGIVYSTIRFRKGLRCNLKITHWPILPSDLPSFNGRHYIYDAGLDAVVCRETGEVAGIVSEGPFTIDDVVFNNGNESVAYIEWYPEHSIRNFFLSIFMLTRTRREEKIRILKDEIVSNLNLEHQHQLERYQSELSEKTRIIQEKMEEIRALKVQQDGDYFLTSLLTRPLIVNRNRSEFIETDYIIRQKKRFSFRKKRSQLGGDLCITDRILLKGRPHVVFVNGDAMGKSMQGAGGALVMGVVFNAYLSRTGFSPDLHEKSPEEWLYEGYSELKRLFAAFEGSMFLTIVMGLVDETNGVLYYMNAEHPPSVLYREGRARFVEEEEDVLPGIGNGLDGDTDFRIRILNLKEGDLFIAGSDGRNDMELKIREEGKTRFEFNTDPTLFLRHVEEGEGDLRRIVASLRRSGRFRDDISLILIKRNSLSPSAEEESGEQTALLQADLAIRYGDLEGGIALMEDLVERLKNRPDLQKRLGLALYRTGGLQRAAHFLERYLSVDPSDTSLLGILSRIYYKLGKLAQAREWAERLYLRRPDDVENLTLLGVLRARMGKRAEAIEVLQKALTKREGDPKIERLLKSLKVRGEPTPDF